jgi:indolepyruvate ferredoxin oxidoreductase
MVMWMDRGSVGYTQMGADGVNWIGEAPFSRRRHVFQNLGDGTYAHSGLLAIRATVAANVNITFKILYNGVVAMTGGQPHDVAITLPRIAEQVTAEGVKRVVVVTDDLGRHQSADLPPSVRIEHRSRLDQVQRELREIEGVTVLIYDQMCATEKRRLRKRGKLHDPAKRAFINHLVCEGCGDCSVKSSCVSIIPRETSWGRKRAIDQSSCNKDFSCVEGFCPSFVTIEGGALVRPKVAVQGVDALPDPVRPEIDGPYNMVLTGIGGTGVITLAAMLGMAAHLEGKGVSTLDMMGLAQKGGSVTSHVRIAREPGQIGTARVPGASADVVLGCDLLTLSSHEPESVIGAKTSLFVNTHEIMPGDFARHRDLSYPTAAIRRRLAEVANPDSVTFLDATALSEEQLGDSIYSNILLLGFAYQRGKIPLSAEAIERAFELNGVQVELNKLAFRAGRKAALHEHLIDEAPAGAQRTIGDIVSERSEFLTDYQNAAYARDYQAFVETVRAAESARVPGSDKLALAVAETLSRLMAYKDEYEVGRLYTSGEFEADLRRQFEEGGKLRFHLAPPLFARRDPVTGEPRKIAFGPWVFQVFKLLARLRFLRGGALDVFGYSAERRMERRLIAEYKALVEFLLSRIDATNIGLAVDIAILSDDIRGFGHIKMQAVRAVKARETELLAEFAKDRSLAA